jgi:hypothetical protein
LQLTQWPDDADGDVFRRLKDNGLDFSRPHKIDFNIDLEEWPPSPEAITLLRSRFPNANVISESPDCNGYAQFQVFEKPTYELVTRIQEEVSQAMRPFGGVCDSWGLLQV